MSHKKNAVIPKEKGWVRQRGEFSGIDCTVRRKGGQDIFEALKITHRSLAPGMEMSTRDRHSLWEKERGQVSNPTFSERRRIGGLIELKNISGRLPDGGRKLGGRGLEGPQVSFKKESRREDRLIRLGNPRDWEASLRRKEVPPKRGEVC